jgi:subtilisin family serine protease
MRGARTLLAVGVALAALSPAAAGASPVRVGLIDSGLGASDPTGHGSEVAAVLSEAARGRAPVRIVSYPDVNRAGIAQPRLMAAAIRRAAADGVRVVNVSQTIPGRAPRVRRALATAPRTLFVVAAGNEGLDLDQPGLDRDPCTAPLPNVVCVGALGADGERAPFSNFGPRSVDAWAPGAGTSFAAPRIAAVAAALVRAHPSWPPSRLRHSLRLRKVRK